MLLEKLLHLVAELGPWAYLIVFGIAAAESAAFLGLLAPGETVTLFAGFLAERDILDLRALIPIVAVAATLGDTIGYEVGRRLGRPWLLKHGRRVGVKPQHLERAQAFFEKHGPKAVFFGRWVGFARARVPFIAGSTHMRYRTFLKYNAMAAISFWISSFQAAIASGFTSIQASSSRSIRWICRSTWSAWYSIIVRIESELVFGP